MKHYIRSIFVTTAVSILLCANVFANEIKNNVITNELQKIKYNYAYAASDGLLSLDEFDDNSFNDDGFDHKSGYKSPGKAFLMSLVVPGLGQYYYGSKIKSVAFLGIEATSWLLHISWHKKGNDLTDEFEAFNNQNWHLDRYEQYLQNVYGVTDDEDIPDSIPHTEVSHNLPDTKTQQYYEMTGKYNQFAWGWDDANLGGMTYADFGGSFPPAIVSNGTTPNSPLRLQYETMRNDANKKLDNANKMLMVVLANHLISSVEAYISTKSHNSRGGGGGGLSNINVSPSLRSYNNYSDTPYMSVSYKF